jgi:hypothetical protein
VRKGATVPPIVVERTRAICLALAEVREEAAWVGIRWRVRTQTFAHLVAVAQGWPPAYAKAAGTDGPVTMLTFQSSGDELEVLSHVGLPFVRPPWRPGIVGMLIHDPDDVDWNEVAELLTESYRTLAPRSLGESLGPPTT